MNMKIGLGTVQFGLPYGISNLVGQTPAPEVAKILALCQNESVKYIDTAHHYGESETCLGETLPRPHGFQIITKTLAIRSPMIQKDHAIQLRKTFLTSLEKLKEKSVYALLAHETKDLLSPGGEILWEQMQELKTLGFVKKIGASVYNGEQIDKLLNKFDLDIVQLPFSVFDQRLIQSGHLKALKAKKIEVHSRSAFLQGLVFMDPKSLPSSMSAAEAPLKKFRAACDLQGYSPGAAALQFCLQQEAIDSVICGVNNLEQLREILQQSKETKIHLSWKDFIINDEKIISPFLWEKKSK